MCFSWHTTDPTFPPLCGECLLRMLEQPTQVDSEPAHNIRETAGFSARRGSTCRLGEAQKTLTRALIVVAARGLTQPTLEQAAGRLAGYGASLFPHTGSARRRRAGKGLPRGRGGLWIRGPMVGARLDRIIHAVVRAVYTEERQIRPELRVYHDTWLHDHGTLGR